jgi:hypothetical protein
VASFRRRAGADALTKLLEGGLVLLEQLVAAARGTAAKPRHATTAPEHRPLFSVTRDEGSSEAHLSVGLPDPEVLDRALRVLGTVIRGLHT